MNQRLLPTTGQSSVLRSRIPSLWTRSYFVATAGDVSSEMITRYIEAQRTKP